jgi:hypothetical protein
MRIVPIAPAPFGDGALERALCDVIQSVEEQAASVQLYIEHGPRTGTDMFLIISLPPDGRVRPWLRSCGRRHAQLLALLDSWQVALRGAGVRTRQLDGIEIAGLLARRMLAPDRAAPVMPALELFDGDEERGADAGTRVAARLAAQLSSAELDFTSERYLATACGLEQVLYLVAPPVRPALKWFEDLPEPDEAWTLSVHLGPQPAATDGPHLSVYHSVRAADVVAGVHALAPAADRAAAFLSEAVGVPVQRGEFRQRELWLSSLPLAEDVALAGGVVTVPEAARALPLSIADAGSPVGTPIAVGARSRRPIRLDLWDPLHRVAGLLITGGEDLYLSAATDNVASQLAEDQIQVVLADTNGCHDGALGAEPRAAAWARAAGDRGGGDHVWAVVAAHEVLLGELSFIERRLLETTIRDTLALAALEGQVPTERDLIARLQARAERSNLSAAVHAAALAHRLTPFAGEGEQGGPLDGAREIEPEKPGASLDLSRLEPALAGVIALDLVEAAAPSDHRRVVVVDAADTLCAHGLAARRLIRAAARGHRDGTGVVLTVRDSRSLLAPGGSLLASAFELRLTLRRGSHAAAIHAELASGLRGRALAVLPGRNPNQMSEGGITCGRS